MGRGTTGYKQADVEHTYTPAQTSIMKNYSLWKGFKPDISQLLLISDLLM